MEKKLSMFEGWEDHVKFKVKILSRLLPLKKGNPDNSES